MITISISSSFSFLIALASLRNFPVIVSSSFFSTSFSNKSIVSLSTPSVAPTLFMCCRTYCSSFLTASNNSGIFLATITSSASSTSSLASATASLSFSSSTSFVSSKVSSSAILEIFSLNTGRFSSSFIPGEAVVSELSALPSKSIPNSSLTTSFSISCTSFGMSSSIFFSASPISFVISSIKYSSIFFTSFPIAVTPGITLRSSITTSSISSSFSMAISLAFLINPAVAEPSKRISTSRSTSAIFSLEMPLSFSTPSRYTLAFASTFSIDCSSSGILALIIVDSAASTSSFAPFTTFSSSSSFDKSLTASLSMSKFGVSSLPSKGLASVLGLGQLAVSSSSMTFPDGSLSALLNPSPDPPN
mmetsp:Transcript_3736/g.4814  ORF Transcript_3736/g.4814 Transcript_3736/m.4814 type:complete len:362 (+) Transcript_3736:1465-2550(+)